MFVIKRIVCRSIIIFHNVPVYIWMFEKTQTFYFVVESETIFVLFQYGWRQIERRNIGDNVIMEEVLRNVR
ncbi:MAG: hypothetical protein CBD38_00690 [bacterium TMED178]|nr:MAG: hypothetical protein CBD38_00690 [bacterium TMED178]